MTAIPEVARFITFEGGEGNGKSTQAKRLVQELGLIGQTVVATREPGGTPGAEDIRRLLVEGEPGRWSPEAESLLHYAARAEHLENVVRPALAAGQWVVSDRFADSTTAYQGYGQGVDLDWLKRLRGSVVRATEPSLTLVFDLPVEKGLARAAAQQRYERMDRAFHERLRRGFLEIAKAASQRCVVIDADRDIDAVAKDVRAAVAARFEVKF